MSSSISFSPVKVGIIGCGVISHLYIEGCATFPALKIVHLADIDSAKARAVAEKFGIPRSGSVEALLADPEVELVINLTIPKVHTEVNLSIINAGKHVYCEKPFGISRNEAALARSAAQERGVLVGSAPDTFMGSAHQTCRKLIDEGAIGRPLSAVAFMTSPGVESWHPNPGFYYEAGGGPMFDMGPYYLTALVNLLGPMRRVTGSAGIGIPERVITSQPLEGTVIKVQTPTHFSGTIDFHSGAIATMIMSFEVRASNLPYIEIYGTEGSLSVPNPNNANGTIRICQNRTREWFEKSVEHTPNAARGIGPADMAYAIRTGRPHRPGGDLACHVVDAMQAFEEASIDGCHQVLRTTCKTPQALPTGLAVGHLDE